MPCRIQITMSVSSQEKLPVLSLSLERVSSSSAVQARRAGLLAHDQRGVPGPPISGGCESSNAGRESTRNTGQSFLSYHWCGSYHLLLTEEPAIVLQRGGRLVCCASLQQLLWQWKGLGFSFAFTPHRLMSHWAMPVDPPRPMDDAWRGPIALEGPEVFSLPPRVPPLLVLEQEWLLLSHCLSPGTEQPQQSCSCWRGEGSGLQAVL